MTELSYSIRYVEANNPEHFYGWKRNMAGIWSNFPAGSAGGKSRLEEQAPIPACPLYSQLRQIDTIWWRVRVDEFEFNWQCSLGSLNSTLGHYRYAVRAETEIRPFRIFHCIKQSFKFYDCQVYLHLLIAHIPLFSGHLSRLYKGSFRRHDIHWWLLGSFVDRTPQAFPSIFCFKSRRNCILANSHRIQTVKEPVVPVCPFDEQQPILSLESKRVIRPMCTR